MIYEGKILNLRRDKVHVKDGKTSYREIIEHNGGVVLAAVTAAGKAVMVRQYRKPAQKVMLEAPAGKIEKDEDPMNAAVRELKEETGYSAQRILHLADIYPSPGYTEEVLHIYLCTELVAGETDFDDNEAIDIEEYDFMELYNLAASGGIDDAKTICALMLAKPQLEKAGLL